MRFEKVSREQWLEDMLNLYNIKEPAKEQLTEINKLYDDVKLPQRATTHSA